MNRIEILNELNDYFMDDNQLSKQRVLDLMNVMINEKSHEENLDLFCMAISMTQMYGYLSYLSERDKSYFILNDYFKANSYGGKKLDFLNSGQLSLLNEIEIHNKVFISAPTSFGKTSIVNEYILNKIDTLNSIIFVVPTNSLLEELFIKYANYFQKNSIVNLSTRAFVVADKKNILFLTPERFSLFYEEYGINDIDLIIMDESYKIMEFKNQSISDFINSRSVRFRKVADLIGNFHGKTIYLSPFTYELSPSMKRFLDKYNIKKIDRKIEYTTHERLLIHNKTAFKTHFRDSIVKYDISNISTKTSALLQELMSEKNIVYVRGYRDAYKIAEKFPQLSFQNKDNQRFEKFLNHLNSNLCIDENTKWKVITSLEKGIGIYISPIPRYIKREIINLFESNILHSLIVTTSFTEGVNTSANNLIFTTLRNGNESLSPIDVLNVAGRAGRFGKNSIGKIYCIKEDIFNKVSELQNEGVIKLENYNYYLDQNGFPKNDLIDYEIDMIESDFLNEQQNMEKLNLDLLMNSLGLIKTDLNISLNVSNKWKLLLYQYFITNDDSIDLYYNSVINLLDESQKVKSIELIFQSIRNCFKDSEVDPFPCEIYDIKPFDKSDEFTWGRLYKLFFSGTIIEVIKKNRKYIQKRYREIVKDLQTMNTDDIKQAFVNSGNYWILDKYYEKDFITEDKDAFYTEAFKFMSSIVQYKIPFYISFFTSVLKLYIIKNKIELDVSKIDLKRIVMTFEDGISSSDELKKLIDFGVSNDVVLRIYQNDISVNSVIVGDYDKSLFDDYEQIILEDFSKVMN